MSDNTEKALKTTFSLQVAYAYSIGILVICAILPAILPKEVWIVMHLFLAAVSLVAAARATKFPKYEAVIRLTGLMLAAGSHLVGAPALYEQSPFISVPFYFLGLSMAVGIHFFYRGKRAEEDRN